jgi:tRNA (guanine6-N2)-methyltransferase
MAYAPNAVTHQSRYDKNQMNHKDTKTRRKNNKTSIKQSRYFSNRPTDKKSVNTFLSTLEVEFLPGLESFIQAELKSYSVQNVQKRNKETLRFVYNDDVKKLFTLRRAVALYEVLEFPIPRPKALLGDEHLRRLIQEIENIRALHPKNIFTSFRFSAAGSDSSVFQKLAEIVSQRLQLPYDAKEGNLLLVIRPSEKGWEVAIRLTPRPLSARNWRVCNLEGGLNATLAVVMNDLAEVKATDRYLNAMCGSGTLLVELRKAAKLVGVDISKKALACAEQNIKASGVRAEVLEADATQLPFAENSFDVITADVPWGDVVGTHEGNAKLYPAFLQEMARITTPSARLVVLTHELNLLEKVLTTSSWQIKTQHRVFHGGHYPNIYLLVKR